MVLCCLVATLQDQSLFGSVVGLPIAPLQLAELCSKICNSDADDAQLWLNFFAHTHV